MRPVGSKKGDWRTIENVIELRRAPKPRGYVEIPGLGQAQQVSEIDLPGERGHDVDVHIESTEAMMENLAANHEWGLSSRST